MSLSEDLRRLADCKTNIKQAIQDKGVQVTSDRFEQYPEFIRTIETSGGDKDYINNPKPDGNVTYYCYTASDRTVYVGGDKGVYAIKDGVATKLFTKYYDWKYFFEASDGTVYVSSSSDNGLYAIKDGVATDLLGDNGRDWQYFFEASDGTVYVGSNISYSGYGLYAIKNGVATQIITSGSNWQYFFEASDGTVYTGGDTKDWGLYAIKNGVATQIITTGYKWQYFFEASDGTVYVSDNNRYGLYAIKNGVATQIITSGSNWQYFFEASDGTVYVSDNSYGVYTIKDGVATQIITTGYYWTTFCELSNGIVLVGSNNNSGLYAIKNGVATKIISDGSCGKFTPIETEDNITVYITGTNKAHTKGVKVIQYNKSESSWGDSTAPIATGVYDYVKPVPSTGEIICSSSTENGIYVVNRSTSVQIHNSEQYKWMLYNDTFISTDRDHQYQYDDTDTLNPVKERTIELPESPKCFITIAEQNTYDV